MGVSIVAQLIPNQYSVKVTRLCLETARERGQTRQILSTLNRFYSGLLKAMFTTCIICIYKKLARSRFVYVLDHEIEKAPNSVHFTHR